MSSLRWAATFACPCREGRGSLSHLPGALVTKGLEPCGKTSSACMIYGAWALTTPVDSGIKIPAHPHLSLRPQLLQGGVYTLLPHLCRYIGDTQTCFSWLSSPERLEAEVRAQLSFGTS
jgi:hypothetical protein